MLSVQCAQTKLLGLLIFASKKWCGLLSCVYFGKDTPPKTNIATESDG